MVWPIPFLINTFAALKGSQFYFYSLKTVKIRKKVNGPHHGFGYLSPVSGFSLRAVKIVMRKAK